MKLINLLKELVTNMEIICDNCGWRWKIKDGGSDLYICHKCNHDNNPEKLQEEKEKRDRCLRIADRKFGDDIDPIELMWHRDDEDRVVEIIGETDWMLQLDNSLPTSIKDSIFIPRHQWHRVIKGTGTLKFKINK